MTRRAILQIGTEKTGTTTLQLFLASNRATLAERGFVYPSFCGARNHTGLAAYALAPARLDPIRESFGATSPEHVAEMRARLRRAAATELSAEAVRDKSAIFCNEHCHSRLISEAEVRCLRDFLRPFFEDVQVCVYLRRQDQVALSLYSTRLKSGSSAERILPQTHAEDPYFNYARSLKRWEEVFGRENLHERLFDRKTLTGGSILSDFVDAFGLGAIEEFAPVTDQNESIRPAAQEFLRLINPRIERLEGLPLEAVRGPLAARLAQFFPGRGARPARAAAEAFYAQFRASNEEVRARYFPERDSLFDESFDSYPELEDDRSASLEDFTGIAAQLHMDANREARRLECEIAIRDARLAWERGEADAAERALDRALGWRPNHADVHRLRAEYLVRQEKIEAAVAAARRAVAARPGAPEFWHFLGVLLQRARDLDGAAEAQRRVLELAPGHAAAERALAQIESAQAAVPAAEPRPDQMTGPAHALRQLHAQPQRPSGA